MSSPAVQVRSRLPQINPQLGRAALEKARLSVVPRRRTRQPRMPFVALVTMVLLGGVVGLLLFNTSMQQASFAATALEEQASTLQSREQTLQMELDVLRDPQHVATTAQKMGMVVGQPPQFLDARTGKVMGLAPDAAGATAGVATTGPTRLRLLPKPAPRPAVLNPAPIVVQAVAPSSTSAGNDGRDTTRGTRGTDGAGGTHGNKPNRANRR